MLPDQIITPYAEVYLAHGTYPRHYVSTVPGRVPVEQSCCEVPLCHPNDQSSPALGTAESHGDGYEVPVVRLQKMVCDEMGEHEEEQEIITAF